MSWLVSLLFPGIKSKAEHENDLKQEQETLVARYTCGNIRLQQGKYLSEEDVEALKQEVVSR